MRKLLLCLLVFGLGIAVAVFVTKPAGAQTEAVDGTLTGSVGTPGTPNAYVISLSADSVPAGTYEFDITDYANAHNFDLHTPGGAVVDKTTVSGTGTATWTVTLSPGVYTFQCDAHPYSMSGTLTVTSTTTTTMPTTTGGGSALRAHIVSAHATARAVTLKVASTTKGRATVQLLKGSKRLAKTSHAVPGKITLKPSRALKPGSYTVKVKVSAGGKTASVKKTIRVR